jgi:pimeloyl-ACP methyl ester carboxylesterase
MQRPQEPQKPYPYKEEEVAYTNKKAKITLAGTLTLPRSERKVPAALLISSSGMQDRDESMFGHRPFLVLADYLTRRGIAVLRVDDRGMGGSGGSMASFFESTSKDFADDVLCGVEYLKTRKEIDSKQIGLIGHSEGGIIAPMVAVQSSDIAFIVLMGGTGLNGEETLLLQNELVLKTVGASDEAIATQLSSLKRTFDILKNEKNNATATNEIRKVMKDSLSKMSEEEQEVLGASEGILELHIKMMVSPWFRFFLSYHPQTTLMKVKCPVLALIGEKDVQVAPKEHLGAIEKALRDGGNKHYVVKELPDLNHLFQTAQTGSLAEYLKIEETISPTALTLIADWIKKL